MTLADPTGGAGYIFGQSLPAAHMTTIATNQPKAVDGNGGGTWTPSAPIILNGTSALQLGGKLKYTARTVIRTQPLVVAARTSLNNWQWSPAPSIGYDWFHANTLGSTFQHELTNIAHNSALTSIEARFKGPTHGASWPVGQLASFRLFSIDAAGSPTGIGAAVIDPSNQAVYESAHTITFASGTGHVFDTINNRYIVLVTAEAGANALIGSIYYGCAVTASVTEQSEV